jgi:hypothetical protein
MDNVVDHIDVLMNIVLWGDGTNERARVSATNTTTGVITCDNSGNLYGSQFIEVNQEVEFRAADGTLARHGDRHHLDHRHRALEGEQDLHRPAVQLGCGGG